MRNKPAHCDHPTGCYQQYRHWNPHDIRVHNRHIQFATALLKGEAARLPAQPTVEQLQRIKGFANVVGNLVNRQWREMTEPQPSFPAPVTAKSSPKTLSLEDLDL